MHYGQQPACHASIFWHCAQTPPLQRDSPTCVSIRNTLLSLAFQFWDSDCLATRHCPEAALITLPAPRFTLHARRSRSLRQQPHILIDCLSYGTSHRKQLQSLLPFGLLMNLSQTAASTRRDTAIQSLLELIRLFEAEALWESVETIRAALDRLRDWDLSAASRLFWHVDQPSPSATICSAGARNCIAERSAIIGSLLRSLTLVPCDSPDHLLEN